MDHEKRGKQPDAEKSLEDHIVYNLLTLKRLLNKLSEKIVIETF